MQRINAFLAEEEVPDWASSLKRSTMPPNTSEGMEKIGYENATLEWHRAQITQKKPNKPVFKLLVNGVEEEERLIESEARHPRLDQGQPLAASDPLQEVDRIQAEANQLGTAGTSAGETTVQPFKLHNINVSLPPGKLTLVTGITGAGKTAFLVGLLGGK